MPKAAPTEVVTHRIEFQESERKMLEQVLGAKAFKDVATPIVDLMKDVSGMVVLLSILAALGITGAAFTFIAVGGLDDMGDLFDQFLTQRQQAIAELGITTALGPASIFWSLFTGRLIPPEDLFGERENLEAAVADFADNPLGSIPGFGENPGPIPSSTTLTTLLTQILLGNMPGTQTSTSTVVESVGGRPDRPQTPDGLD